MTLEALGARRSRMTKKGQGEPGGFGFKDDMGVMDDLGGSQHPPIPPAASHSLRVLPLISRAPGCEFLGKKLNR